MSSLSWHTAFAQSYEQEIFTFREHYKNEFVNGKSDPLTSADTAFLDFFPPDKTYRVTAKAQLLKKQDKVRFPTSGTKIKTFRPYALLIFEMDGHTDTLTVFQSPDALQQPEYEDHLFLPFSDLSSAEATYGGGRYLDLKIGDFKNGTVILDFNKAYNPYCAYSSGYNCPIPPSENRLNMEINAGEKKFLGRHKD